MRFLGISVCFFAAFIASLLCIMPASAMDAAGNLGPDLSEQDRMTLQSGDTVMQVWASTDRPDKAMEVFGGIDIAAPPEVIWDIMLDCERADDIVKDMTACTVLESDPDGLWDIREQKLKVGFLLPKSRLVFRSDYNKPHTITISRAGGDMAVQEGAWHLTPLADGKTTRVTYAAALRPKFPVPGGMLRRATRKDVPEILQNLRRESESDFANRP